MRKSASANIGYPNLMDLVKLTGSLCSCSESVLHSRKYETRSSHIVGRPAISRFEQAEFGISLNLGRACGERSHI